MLLCQLHQQQRPLQSHPLWLRLWRYRRRIRGPQTRARSMVVVSRVPAANRHRSERTSHHPSWGNETSNLQLTSRAARKMFYPLVYLTKENLPVFSVSSRYSFFSYYNALATRLDCNFPSQSKFDRSSRVSKNPVTGTCSGPASIAQASSLPSSNNKNSQQQQQHDLSDSTADLEPILPENLVAENNHQKAAPSTSNTLSR